MSTNSASIFSRVFLTLLLFVASVPAAGVLDATFDPGLVELTFSGNQTWNRLRRTVIQPDGKILIGGYFRAVGTAARDSIARLNPNGSIDTAFIPPAILRNGTTADIYAIALQADGKILIGGDFNSVAGITRRGVVRLNSDGTLDGSFNITGVPGHSYGGIVHDIEASADNKITFGGDFSYSFNSANRPNLARVLPDGSIDLAWDPDIVDTGSETVYDVVLTGDGRTVIAIHSSGSDPINIYGLNSTGGIDFTRNVGGVVYRIAQTTDGKFMLGGNFTSLDGFPVPADLARLNTNGSVDPAFNFDNVGGGNDIRDVEALANGKILVAGNFGSFNGVSRRSVALINPDGSLDDSLNFDTVVPVMDTAIQPDGKLVIGATTGTVNSSSVQEPLFRLHATGALDNSFRVPVGNIGRGSRIIAYPDGRILVGGFFTHADGIFRSSLARLNTDGTNDLTLSRGFTIPPEVPSLELQSDGVILWGHFFPTTQLGGFVRLRANGSGFPNFGGTNGYPHDLRGLPNGGALASLDRVLKRFDAGGVPDAAFNVSANEPINKIRLQPDGKIIVGGRFTSVAGSPRSRIARLNADGTIDITFDAGPINSAVNDIGLQPDGKVVIGGQFGLGGATYLARLNTDGSQDTGFLPVFNGEVRTLKVQTDGKIVVGGLFTTVNGVTRNRIARLNVNGSVDLTFDPGLGANNAVNSVDVQPDGNILVAGDFTRFAGVDRLGVARLLNTATPAKTLFDYDGDARADISVFRASENRWYVFQSSDATVSQTVFAIAGDVPVPADYDGDLKTDVAIYRPSSGAWWYLSSLDGGQKFAQWGGEAGDIPRPSDFDGDGRTDFIIFRPANNVWYRISNTLAGTVSNVQFGLAGDKPVRGDFDGDGKSDVAIYRPSTGDWWYQSSINNAQLAVRWGISTDIPAPADFDGDGRTDFAVYRPSTGVWYVINSSNGSFLIGPFGTPEDKPVPADYDGDGKAELAVFRPSTGIWYQLRTNGGFFAMQFGIGTDTPTPNSFVP